MVSGVALVTRNELAESEKSTLQGVMPCTEKEIRIADLEDDA